MFLTVVQCESSQNLRVNYTVFQHLILSELFVASEAIVVDVRAALTVLYYDPVLALSILQLISRLAHCTSPSLVKVLTLQILRVDADFQILSIVLEAFIALLTVNDGSVEVEVVDQTVSEFGYAESGLRVSVVISSLVGFTNQAVVLVHLMGSTAGDVGPLDTTVSGVLLDEVGQASLTNEVYSVFG